MRYVRFIRSLLKYALAYPMCSAAGVGRSNRIGKDRSSSYGAEETKRGDGDIEATGGEEHIGEKLGRKCLTSGE